MNELNVKPSTIFCDDNLDILQGINSDCIDLIYLDPPFNKKKVFTALIGSSAEGADFSDIFREEDIKEEWIQSIHEDNIALFELLDFARKSEGRSSYNFCYLAYMAIRLMECHRILKETGSLYLHCDPTMSHYLKLLLDCIFGEKNFRNEIIWHYETGGIPVKDFARKHDCIYRYSKSNHYIFNPKSVLEKRSDEVLRRIAAGNESATRSKGKYRHPSDIFKIPSINAMAKERVGYPTQKPLELLERIIKASSNKDDIILDPFCGCATTCIASERLERKWIGIDISQKAFDLVRQRLEKEVPVNLFRGHPFFKTDPPKRTDDFNPVQEKKWVYVISHNKYKKEYKIGIAKDWKSRLNSYQTADPDRNYQMEFKFHTPYYREIEKYIHEKFENKHEWVKGDLKEIIFEIENWQA